MDAFPRDYHLDVSLVVLQFASHSFLRLVYVSVFFDIEYGRLCSSVPCLEVQSELLLPAVSHVCLHKILLQTLKFPLSFMSITNLLFLSRKDCLPRKNYPNLKPVLLFSLHPPFSIFFHKSRYRSFRSKSLSPAGPKA